MSDRLLVKNAKLRDGSVTDILVEDGKFAKIQPKIQIEQVDTIDAKERLVSPPFCDAHLHLDAVLSVGRPRYNQSGTLLEGIQIWSELKEKLDKETIKKNAIEVIQWEAVNGSMFLRTHADATDSSGNAVEALLEVKEAVKDFVDLQSRYCSCALLSYGWRKPVPAYHERWSPVLWLPHSETDHPYSHRSGCQ